MKLVKTVLIILEILFAISTAFAQETSVGLRIGASYFNLNNDELNDDAKYTTGVDVAIPVEFNLSPNFSIQPELHFIQKGVQFEEMIEGEEESFAVKTNYLELPILLKAKYGQEKFKCYAFAAPSVGFATNRFTVEKIGDGDRIKEEVDFIDAGDAKSQRWEFSAIAGVGCSMKAGAGSIVLDVRYNLGLSDNTKFKGDKPSDWEKTTNRGCTLSVGYMIPIGGK